MLENYSKKELDFVKYFRVERTEVDKTVNEIVAGIKNTPEVIGGLRKICNDWNIGTICDNLILRESTEAMLLSGCYHLPTVMDELHKDVIGLIDNLSREEQSKRLLIDTLSKVMQIAVPDYSSLTFQQILDLRSESSIKKFRSAVTEISEKLMEGQRKDSYAIINQEINKRLIEDLKKIAPKGFHSIILSAAADCMLALPVLSTLALGKTVITSIRDARKTKEWKSSFGCFWIRLSE